MFFIELSCTLILGILSLAVCYLYFLAVAAIWGHKHTSDVSRVFRSLILVPAHNEEKGILATLSSLQLLSKPGPTEIVVIADNCSDSTARVSRDNGVHVLERFDPLNRGKGFALEWALGKVDVNAYDAVVFIDADTLVQPNMLRAMASVLTSGHGAVQLSYRFKASEGQPVSYLQEMASHVENMLFYRGRSNMNLPILLRGSGMAIRADVIRTNPWDSHSVTEDVDYAVNLICRNVSIGFSTDSAVDSAATSSYRQFEGQKKRWASGTFQMIRQRTWPLIKQGFSDGRFELIELALSFFLLSRPALIIMVLPALALAVFAPSSSRLLLVCWALAVISAIMVYMLLGLVYVKSKWQTIKALLHLPVYVLWYMKTGLGALLGHKKPDWVRTDRK